MIQTRSAQLLRRGDHRSDVPYAPPRLTLTDFALFAPTILNNSVRAT